MRRGWAIAAAILVVLVTVGIAVGAYNAGVDEGVRRAADSSQVVQVVGDRYGHGFFPFGFFLFPLFIIGTIFLVEPGLPRPARPGATTTGPGTGRGPRRVEPRFEDKAGDWHRRQHEQASGGEETTGPPAG